MTVFKRYPNTIALLETADHKVFARITFDSKARVVTIESDNSNAVDVAMMLDVGDLLEVKTVNFNVPANQETILITCPFKIS